MKNTMKKTVYIPVSRLRPFEGHPFKVKDDEEMNTLIESIQTQGVLSPLIVRPIENTDEYEVISGHRRLHAAIKAGITEVPALIYALDRDSAAIAVVDSNLHREHILPSEKAFAYKLKMEALNHQGITCGQVGHKSRDNVSDTESGRTVQRYIRLTNLIPELLEFMDEGKMALSVGVELSYLDDQSQYDVLEQCEQNDCTPSYSQAWRMHKLYEDIFAGKLSDERYSRMAAKYEKEQAELLQSVGAQEKELIELERETVDVRLLLAGLREYSSVEKLTPEVVNKIIKRIEVHNSEVVDGHKQVKIDIYFTDAGLVDLATVKEMLAIAEAAQK